jgi:AcrR family transcriptional regulator
MNDQPPRSRREEYTAATRAALLEAGKAAFARDGFQASGIDAISRTARVTRGAFYHHFEDKTALFDAVVVALQKQAAAEVASAPPRHLAIWDKLFIGIAAYLDVCLDPTYARIVVKEAPTVLGEKRFREIEEAYPMALLSASLRALQERGEIEVDDVLLLTRMVDAMICKLSLVLLEPDAGVHQREEGLRLIRALLETVRRR